MIYSREFRKGVYNINVISLHIQKRKLPNNNTTNIIY